MAAPGVKEPFPTSLRSKNTTDRSAMIIELSDQIVQEAQLSKEELRLAIAVWLFVEKSWSLGRSAKVAGLHKIQFQRELAKRKIPIHYTEEDLDRDMEAIKRIP